ncbi:MAG: DHH family phosphoesterase, partial [Halothiobacillus sp.]
MSGIESRLAEILVTRGIVDPEQINPDLSLLLPPAGMPGIELAADILANAVREHARILIVGDFDADGATATALCVRALRAMGAKRVEYTLPDRQRHGYGLSPALLKDWIAEADAPPDVILTVDNGIAAFAGVAAALTLNATVIITDHHLPGDTLPPAHAIVNPNLNGSDFASKAIAGVGVAFYVMAALRERLSALDWFTGGIARPNLARWLDLVAVGTVA